MPLVAPSRSPTAFRLLSFDVYGTLVDWETGLYTALSSTRPISSLPATHPIKQSRLALLSAYEQQERRLQLEQPQLAYSALLAETYRRTIGALSPPPSSPVAEAELEAAAAHIPDSVADWPAFPDTVEALRRLSRRYKLVPLSNVDEASIARTLSGALAGAPFDAVYTAERIGSYKPARANFDFLAEHARSDFGVDKAEIWHVAQSLHHDHVPASEFGFETGVWVDRNGVMGKPAGELVEKAKYGWRVGSLKELADLVDEAFAAEGSTA